MQELVRPAADLSDGLFRQDGEGLGRPSSRRGDGRPGSVAPVRARPEEQDKHIDDTISIKDQAIRNLRMLILAGERYRQVLAEAIGLGTTESQALSYLEVHGDSGQSTLAGDLGLTSSALTALVDRLERQGVAERVPHPQDRRRSMIRVTERGAALVVESHGWLDATLDRIDPADLELVSASLAAIANDLSARRSGHDDAGAGLELPGVARTRLPGSDDG